MINPCPRIHASPSRRFLITAEGKPFFWLGDTAWNLFHRTLRPEAVTYLKNRQQKGFNVIQAVVLAEQNGLTSPSANGERPLFENDPTRPNEAYFAYVDELIDFAAGLGLYICLLPTWADKVTPDWGDGPVVFNPQNAYTFGQWIGSRYGGRSNVIWCLGGDRPLVRDDHDWRLIWRAMAAGIADSVGDEALMTYHPDGGDRTPSDVHAESWSNLLMIQSGHWARENPAWDWIDQLYHLQPPKPVLDGEPNYEDHPVAPWPTWDPANGYFRDYEIRKQVYRSVFAGGCGVTYGHHAVWQFYGSRYAVINHVDRTWLEALDRPGAGQMVYLKNLMLSRPYFHRIPDQLLLSDAGQGASHVRSTRSVDGQYAFIYIPNASQVITVDLAKLVGPAIKAWWYDPRTGWASEAGVFPCQRQAFLSPADDADWVLVLDTTSADFSPPGEIYP